MGTTVNSSKLSSYFSLTDRFKVMAIYSIPVAVVFLAVFAMSASVQGNTCDACDECPLSNVEILHHLIDARINATTAARVKQFTAAEEYFNATVNDRINAVNTTISALNARVDESLATVRDMVEAHDTSLTRFLSQQGPGKFAEHARCIVWIVL